MKFLSRTSSEAPLGADPGPEPASGKGRPTPSRKESEARRKQALKIPTDPKAARKAARARASEERTASRSALLTGDERHLPKRDAGPVKAFVRDFVDSRWASAELFLPIALVVLVVGFLPIAGAQQIVSTMWTFLVIFIGVDTTILLLRMRRALSIRWPDKADRKGTTLYAVMRVLQLRILRLPPPKVRIGGKPVKPKKGKSVPAPAARPK